jgi:hypothetical protein
MSLLSHPFAPAHDAALVTSGGLSFTNWFGPPVLGAL